MIRIEKIKKIKEKKTPFKEDTPRPSS